MPVTALVQPGPGGGDHAAELAGLARVAVGRVRRDLLVAHVDDADALIDAAVVDVDDVAAAQREDRVHAFVLERLGDQVAAGDHARVAALALQSIFGGRRPWAATDAGFTVAMSASNVSDSSRGTGGSTLWFQMSAACGPRCSRRAAKRLATFGEVPRAHGLQHEQRQQRRDDVAGDASVNTALQPCAFGNARGERHQQRAGAFGGVQHAVVGRRELGAEGVALGRRETD